MGNAFSRELGVPMPQCCSTADCCKGASPSTPFHELLARSARGDDFARGFFSIMVPYPSHEEARKVVPGLVERTLAAARKQEAFGHGTEDVVFYHCRYLLTNNRCGVHEDRPQFCRDYPDSPYVVMAPGCSFEPWAKTCKAKYQAMKNELSQLKALKQELDTLKSAMRDPSEALPGENTDIDDLVFSSDNATRNLSLVLSLTRLYLSSPLQSYLLRAF